MAQRKDPYEQSETDPKKKSSNDALKAKVDEALKKMSKKGRLTSSDYAELAKQYGDDEALLDAIIRRKTKRYSHIRKMAHKLAFKVWNRYKNGTKTLHEILDRMLRYKIDNEWSDQEFDEFRTELTALLTGNRAFDLEYNQNLTAYKSRINRTLGAPMVWSWTSHIGDGLRIKDTERGVLGEILSMQQTSYSLHRSVFMSSLMYEDCSLVAMTGSFDRTKHIASNYIHPLSPLSFYPNSTSWKYICSILISEILSDTKYEKTNYHRTGCPALLQYYHRSQ